MSLKQKLIDTLQTNGRLDLNELSVLCREYPAKVSTAEKRLREFREPLHTDFHPEVKVEMKNGYINAYVWQPNKYISPLTSLPVKTEGAKKFLKEWQPKKELTLF